MLSPNAEQIPTINFPARLMLEATNICNNRCIFCPHHNSKRNPVMLDLDFAAHILARAFTLGARECAFHGGSEPCLHPRLHDLVRMAKQAGYDNVYLTTNALACSWDHMQEVLESGLNSLKFSVNAGTAEDYKRIHGRDGFERVRDMARRVHQWRKQKQSPLSFYISAVTCSDSAANMPKLTEAFTPYVDKVVPYPAMWLGERTALSISETVRRFPAGAVCNEIFTRCTITSSGFVRVCCSGSDDYMLIGDANSTDLLDIWNSEAFVALRESMLAHDIPSGTVCHNCINFTDTPLRPLVQGLALQSQRWHQR